MVALKMPARHAALLLLVTGTLVLAGCETSPGKHIDYKSVTSAPPLEIPPDLSTPRFDDRYAANTASGLAQQDANRPKNADLLPKNPDAHIARAGQERWLVVKATPEEAWTQVHKFWTDQGFVIATEQPALGTMETDWAENRAEIPNDIFRKYIGKYFDVFYSTYKRDKFRTRIERGVESGTTEIYISHRGMEQVPTTKIDNSSPAAFAWAAMPENPELEADMLSRLMVRFGATEPQADAAIAQSTAQPDRARIEKAKDGGSQLIVDDTFDHAWRRVGLALDRSGFTVVDRDRSKGLYYVRYADPEADMAKKDREKGFLSKLMFWKKDDENKPEQYRVLVAEASPRSLVSVQDANGTRDRTEIGDKILGLLQDQLK
ncbi:MAG TPA: outer membrane protein assembly factor BamC [Casimicrobiaceae bacterium]|jgi:outer membrane protein assembly factor BamC